MKRSDIIIKIENALSIFDQCYILYTDLKYLRQLSEKEEQVFQDFRFLMRTIDYEWKLLIIELYKLFKGSEHHSISKILNIVIENYKTIDWKNNIELSKLKAYQLELDENKFKESLTTLYNLREKFIAHLDNNSKDYLLTLKIDNVKLLMDFGEKCLLEIYDSLANGKYLFNRLGYSGIESITNKILELKGNK